MRTDICNDLPKCRIIFILTAMMIMFGTNNLFAQSNPIYQNGNVVVYQYSHGWEIMHGNNLVGYGDGELDMETLHPAFKELIDFYAVEPVTKVTKRPKTKAAPTITEEYGPLVKTKWFQRSPYNELFPEIPDENSIKQHALVGCTSVSSGMLMNFFHYCKPFEVIGTNTIADISPNLTSPFISNVSSEVNDGKTYVTFDYDFAKQYSTSLFTPDFEAMKSDNNEISKYLLAIAFVQQAGFGLDVTLTTRDKQMKAIKNLYGYDYVNYSYTKISNLELTYNNVIADAIKKGWPVIVGGQTSEGSGHSYMIDGIDGDFFHFEYGWGGKDNGWFTVPAKYAYNYNIIIAHPNLDNFAYLKPNPKYLYIKGVGNNFNQRYEMKQTGSNKWSYCQKEPVDLPAGTYEYYFEYADGTKIAPYTSETIELNSYTSPYSCTGLFSSQSAKITLEKDYKLNFWHKLNMGEIMIEGIDFKVDISGKVLDLSGNPVVGAFVACPNNMPIISEDDSYEITTNNWSVPKSPSWRTNTFTPSNNYLSGLDIYLHSKKGDPGALTVAILDYSNKVVWSKQIAYEDVVTGKWMHIDFDETVFLVPYDPYFVALASEYWQSGVNSYYTKCDGTDEHNIAFRTYVSDVPFVKSRSDGSYICNVDKYSSLQLTAFTKDMIFNTLDIDNVTENLHNKNIVQTGFTYIVISGKVLDKDNYPIEGAVITSASAIPVPIIDQSNPPAGSSGNRVYTYGVAKEFVPTKFFLTQLDLMLFRKGEPGNIHVSISDVFDNTLWEDDILSSSIPTSGKNYIELKFSKPIAVDPGQTYRINLISTTCNDDNRCNYFINEDNHQMVYRVWGCNDYYSFSDSDGKYVYRTDGGFSGKLHAYYDTKTFGTVSFTQQMLNISDINFIENGENIVIDRTMISISVQKPTKTEYLIGEAFNPAGMVVKAKYDNGSEETITSGYEIAGFDSSTEGEKTITVTYGEFSATFVIKVDEIMPVSSVNQYDYLSVWSFKRIIYIDNALNAEIRVIDLNGRIVRQMKSSTSRCEIHLNKSGVFVVVVAGRSFKVMLSE